MEEPTTAPVESDPVNANYCPPCLPASLSRPLGSPPVSFAPPPSTHLARILCVPHGAGAPRARSFLGGSSPSRSRPGVSEHQARPGSSPPPFPAPMPRRSGIPQLGVLRARAGLTSYEGGSAKSREGRAARGGSAPQALKSQGEWRGAQGLRSTGLGGAGGRRPYPGMRPGGT